PIGVAGEPDHLPPTKGPSVEIVVPDLCAASPDPSAIAQGRDQTMPVRLQDIPDLDVKVIERLEIGGERLLRGVYAPKLVEIGRNLGLVRDAVWGEELGRKRLLLTPLRVDTAHDLDVLLRHRLPVEQFRGRRRRGRARAGECRHESGGGEHDAADQVAVEARTGA